MYCSKCGKENEDGSKYCLSCGSELNQGGNNELHTEDVKNEAVSSENEAGSIRTEEAISSYNIEGFTSAQEPTPRKKSRKLLVAAISLSVLVIAAVLVYIFYPKISMGVMGPQQYYLKAESKNFSEIGKSFSKLMKQEASSFSMKGDFSAKAEGDNVPAEVSEMLNSIRLNIELDADMSKKTAREKISLKNGDEELSFLAIMKDKKMAISFPGIEDRQYVTEAVNAFSDIVSGEEDTLKEITGLDEKTREKLIDKFLKEVIVKSIPNDKIEKSAEVLDGINCSTVNFKIDEDVVANMCKALANMLEEDEQLKGAVKSAIKYAYNKGSSFIVSGDPAASAPSDEDIDNLLKEAIESLKDADIDDGALFYKVYYNFRGEIVARQLKDKDDQFKLVIKSYEKDKESVFEIKLDTNGSEVTLNNTYTENKGIMDGSLKLKTDNAGTKTSITLKYDFDKNAKIGGVPLVTGNAKLSISQELSFNSKYSQKFDISMSFEKVSDDEVKLSVNTDEIDGVKFSLEGNMKISKDVNLDDANIDENNALSEDEYFEVMLEFQKKLGIGAGKDIYDGYDDFYDDGMFDDLDDLNGSDDESYLFS